MIEKENKSVYAKPTRRKVDGYRVWEIYDEKGTLLMNACDVIHIEGNVNVELTNDGRTHYWSFKGLVIEPLIKTLIIKGEK